MGILYLVATPIGNLQDLTFRALDILKQVHLLICEDTRRTLKLLNHFLPPEIVHQKTLLSFNDFNEKSKTPLVIQKLVQGQNAALISDAGTPLISDPGYTLIQQAILHQIPLEVIPGPSAAVSTALISGLPTDRIVFWGFLPKKAGDKQKVFTKFQQISLISSATFIVFDSPFRLKETISLLQKDYPSALLALSRELTKLHQEVFRGTPQALLTQISDNPKGEVTLAIRLDINPERH